MRSVVIATLGALAFAGAAQAGQTSGQALRAPSAEHYAVNASYSTRAREHGYSARARQIADCLTTVAVRDNGSHALSKAAADRRCTI